MNPIVWVPFIQFFLFVSGFSSRLPPVAKTPPVSSVPPPLDPFSPEDRYNMNWYVIGEAAHFRKKKLYKTTIWNKPYVFWRDEKQFYAMDDDCSHRGASLAQGQLHGNNVVCPYHGYEFNKDGVLMKVPGLPSFHNTPCQNQLTYRVEERAGWLFLNTVPTLFYEPVNAPGIFVEPEATNPDFKSIFVNMKFDAYSRIVSENSLDVMHIGFVHTFGNREEPSPVEETPPFLVPGLPYHYKTIYTYRSGKDSMAKKWFGTNELVIENEFVLPHFTVARVLFGPFVSTVITFATPINETTTLLYVKTYRNFWFLHPKAIPLFEIGNTLVQKVGDKISTFLMEQTMLQDKRVIEKIRPEKQDGRFNMKYDKLQNVYRQMYKKWIHQPANK